MLTRVSPVEFVRPMRAGRTGPALLLCETADGTPHEVVVKFSGGCDENVVSLAREVIAACLAGDLGLPIPQPFLVEVGPEWSATITDPTIRARAQSSSPIAFGSRLIAGQYAAWSEGTLINAGMLPAATAIFVFDAITQNVDRRAENPNCLAKGDEIRIFDHEMCFTHGLIIGWRPPWVLGGLKVLETPGFHIFREQLRQKSLDLVQVRGAWQTLSDLRLSEYGAAIPAEWSAASAAVQRALALIRDARDNIDDCLAEVQRVLT